MLDSRVFLATQPSEGVWRELPRLPEHSRSVYALFEVAGNRLLAITVEPLVNAMLLELPIG